MTFSFRPLFAPAAFCTMPSRFLPRGLQKLKIYGLFIAAIFAFCLSTNASDRDHLYNDYLKIYVSVSGNDNAEGSKKNPVKTIKKAVAIAEKTATDASNYKNKKGIAILFKTGIYKISEPIRLHPDITKFGELCFDALEENVILSGKERVTSTWQSVGNGIFKTNIGAGKIFRELYINNESAVRARYPNVSGKGADKDVVILDKYTKDAGQLRFYFQLKGNTSDINYFNQTLMDKLRANLGDVEMFMIQEWALSIGKISDIGYDSIVEKGKPMKTVSFRLDDDAEKNHLHRGWPRIFTKQPHWLENSLALLDAENEWYYDKREGFLYYKPRKGTDIHSLKIEYPGAAESLFEIKGKESTATANRRVKHISFKNLTIEGSNWTYPSLHSYLDQQNGQYNIGKEDWMERPQAAILLEWAEDISFEGNVIRNMASTAIDCYQGTKNIRVVGNAFGEIGGSAVSFGQRSEKTKNIGKFTSYYPDNREEITQQIHIENNYFEACGKNYVGATTIGGGYAMEIYIRQNEINGSAHDAISVGWGWQTEKSVMREIHIDNNRLINVKANRLLYDGSGLYVLGVHDVTDVDKNGYPLSTMNGNYMVYLGGACGLYFDNGVTHFSAKDNVVDGRKRIGRYDLGHVYINDEPLRDWTILNIHVDRTYGTDLFYMGPMDGKLPKPSHNRILLENKPGNGIKSTARNITVKNSVLVADGDLSKNPKAQAIVDASGLEKEYLHIKSAYRLNNVSDITMSESVKKDRARDIVLPKTDWHYNVTKSYVEDEPDNDYVHASESAYESFRDIKYSIRIHWGVYSMKEIEASWPLLKMSPEKKAEYQNLYKTFNPTEFDAQKWMDFFKRSGIQAFAFTTKHHDGFSMFHTKTRVKQRVNYLAPNPRIEPCDLAYSIENTPFKRDIVKELCDAAHKNGIKIDLYFSHPDWFDADFRPYNYHPLTTPSLKTNPKDYGSVMKYDPSKIMTPNRTPEETTRLVGRHREQIRELLSNYGKIDMICFDQWMGRDIWPEMRETVKMMRKLQPDVMIRCRGIGNYGDYYQPEQVVPGNKAKTNMPWMSICLLGKIFAFDPNGNNYKGAPWVIHNLIDCVAKGGSFMVCIGPDQTGKFHPKAVEQLEETGQWLKINGEGIYGTRARDVWKKGNIYFTRSKDKRKVFAFVEKWPGTEIIIPSVTPQKESKLYLLGYPAPLKWSPTQDGVKILIPDELQLPENRPCKYAWGFQFDVK